MRGTARGDDARASRAFRPASIRKEIILAIEYAQSVVPAFFCWLIVASMAVDCCEFVFKFGLERTFPFSGWDSNSVDWNPLQPRLMIIVLTQAQARAPH